MIACGSLNENLPAQFVRSHRNALATLQYLQGVERHGVTEYRVKLQGVADGLCINRRYLPVVGALLAKGI
jgi:DNA-binding LytR/AlgR family response regulator